MKPLFVVVVAFELLLCPLSKADLRGVWSRNIQVGGKILLSGDSLGVDGELVLDANAEKQSFSGESFKDALFQVSRTLRSRELIANSPVQSQVNSAEILGFLTRIEQEVREESAYITAAMELPLLHIPAVDGFNIMLQYRVWSMSFVKTSPNQWTCDASISKIETEVVSRDPDRIFDPARFAEMHGEGPTPGAAFAHAFPIRK